MISKLRMNRPLTVSDLEELERMLAESGIAKSEDISRAKAESQGLGLFVRTLVGMDRGAAKQALSGFLNRNLSIPLGQWGEEISVALSCFVTGVPAC